VEHARLHRLLPRLNCGAPIDGVVTSAGLVVQTSRRRTSLSRVVSLTTGSAIPRGSRATSLLTPATHRKNHPDRDATSRSHHRATAKDLLTMLPQNHFAAKFNAAITDHPVGDPDYVSTANNASARAVAIEAEPWGEPGWSATFSAPDPGVRALTALLPTPAPTGLCVVERGKLHRRADARPDRQSHGVRRRRVAPAVDAVVNHGYRRRRAALGD
jgi:hypothetical protein